MLTLGFFIITLVILLVYIISKKEQRNNNRIEYYEPEPEEETIHDNNDDKEFLPYHFKYLLTKNEWEFYKKLKVTADKYNLHIIAKVRLADLVEVDKYLTGNGFNKYFSKIMSKHVDFVICNPNNLAVKFIIELADSSHTNDKKRAQRDDFVDKVLKKCGYKVIYTYGGTNLDEIFDRTMNL